ncbi:MAG: hypothetical protein CMO80_08465 [Verrucomicrobiales bacterium]|nr:hypothetical protein [Verrucomicrobiales bacterium]
MSDEEPVFMFEGDDPDMHVAAREARSTFKFFWRELSWERRRIVPAIDIAMIKLPFTDGVGAESPNQGEHMWVDKVDFDGQRLTGVLVNSPRWLKSVKDGDPVNVPFAHLEDWLMTSGDTAFGGYTVNVMRRKMSAEEMETHDEAWGLDFGDPFQVRLQEHDIQKHEGHVDHPMCTNTIESLRKHVQENPGFVADVDETGWAELHRESLAGNLASVKLLVEHGADPRTKTRHGLNAIELARALAWEEVAAYLESA